MPNASLLLLSPAGEEWAWPGKLNVMACLGYKMVYIIVR